MKLIPFLSQSKSLNTKLSSTTTPPWPFPTCANIKTLSFRALNHNDEAFITYNSTYLNVDDELSSTPNDSFFTISSSCRSFSTLSDDYGDPVETVINRGLRSDRLFFEPERSNSLLLRQLDLETEPEPEPEVDKEVLVAYEESELLSMESKNPYEDFKSSMEEMVQAHRLKDWQGLEGLLGCYLKVNGENNHGYIIGAFIDLLVSLSFDASSTSSTSTSTTNNYSSSYSSYSSPFSPLSLPSSSIATPCLSSILDHDNDGHDDDDDHI